MPRGLVNLPLFAKLSECVCRVLGTNPSAFTLQGTNTYLIGTGSQKILLDTGEGKPEYIRLLAESLKTLGDNVHITDILISHWHLDHVGGVDDILEYYAQNNLTLPRVHKRLEARHDNPHHQTIFNQIEDNQIFRTEGATIQAIYTPGHCEDHLAFYLKEENALFTGDSLLGQGTTVFENLGKYIDSLKRMQRLLPGRLYPGHGPVVEDGKAKIREYLDHRMA
ncbi:15044_t:CDS:2, partial [Acaulospora morrowiae]